MTRITKIWDDFPIPFDDEKKNLLLVYAGVKPATTIELEPLIVIDSNSPEFMKDVESRRFYGLDVSGVYRFRIALNLLGLPYHEGPKQFVETAIIPKEDEFFRLPPKESIEVHIGKNRNCLERMITAKTDEELGIAYGFPLTAVEAHVGKRESMPEEQYLSGLPKEYKQLKAFAHYTLSEDNWREELETGMLWAEACKRLHPKIYRNLLFEQERYDMLMEKGVITTRVPSDKTKRKIETVIAMDKAVRGI